VFREFGYVKTPGLEELSAQQPAASEEPESPAANPAPSEQSEPPVAQPGTSD